MYALALFLPAVLGVLACIFQNRYARIFSIAMCGISCISGILAFPMFIYNGQISFELPINAVWGRYSFIIDELSALIMTVSSAVFLMIAVHMYDSESSPKNTSYVGLMNILFIASMSAMCCDNAILLLISWELVSLSTFMMAREGAEDTTPMWRFFVITHFGGLMIAAAFLYMCFISGTMILSEWTALNSVMGVTASCIVITLLFFGFGTKLGIVPFHAWMPEMYSESPTHTTALLSTVCSNVAILLLIKSIFGYIGAVPETTVPFIVLVLFSCISAIWGAMESLVQKDPKKILAYSSMENMSLVLLCISLGTIFMSANIESLALLTIVAAVLHTLNHSVFKSLMLMSVGTVEDSSRETSIERMGGLALKMKLLSVAAIIGTVSLAGIPPFNGFVSEWMMLQSMMSMDGLLIGSMKVMLPLGVAVLAICGTMAAVSYARLYGFIFLGRPRSEGAADPKPARKISMLPLVLLATSCLAMGILAAPICDEIAVGISAVAGFDTTSSYTDSMPGVFEPMKLFLFGGVIFLIIIAISFIGKKPAVKNKTWDCGTPLQPNMQYSSMGFSQPLVKIFHPMYGDTIEMKGSDKSDKKTYEIDFAEPFVNDIVRPIGKIVLRISQYAGKLQTGNIQSYLAYILITLIVVLLAVRFLC